MPTYQDYLRELPGLFGDIGEGVAGVAPAIASGLVAQPVAGLHGLGAGALAYGRKLAGALRGEDTSAIDPLDIAANRARSTQEALTYEPRGAIARRGLENVSGAVAPVSEAVDKYVLDPVGERSPVAGAVGAALMGTIGSKGGRLTKVRAVSPTRAAESLEFLPKTADPYVASFSERLPNQLPARGKPIEGRVADLAENKAAQQAIQTAILRGEQIDPTLRFWYGTSPLAEVAAGEGLTQAEYERMVQHLAAASQRNPVPQQVRMGSHMWKLDRSGLLLPENREQALAEGALVEKEGARGPYTSIAWPEGYGSLAQKNISDAALKIGQGDYPFDDRLKLGRFNRSFIGYHPENAVIDVIGTRVPTMASRDPRWLVTAAKVKEGGVERTINPRAMHESGELSMDEALKRPGFWTSAPENVGEYKVLEDMWLNAGRRMGAPGGEGQALGWYGSAGLEDEAGLKSKPMTFMRAIEQGALGRARQTGGDPYDILKRFVRGEETLY